MCNRHVTRLEQVCTYYKINIHAYRRVAPSRIRRYINSFACRYARKKMYLITIYCVYVCVSMHDHRFTWPSNIILSCIYIERKATGKHCLSDQLLNIYLYIYIHIHIYVYSIVPTRVHSLIFFAVKDAPQMTRLQRSSLLFRLAPNWNQHVEPHKRSSAIPCAP